MLQEDCSKITMNDTAIESYLSLLHLTFDEHILEQIKDKLKEGQNESNEEKSNYYWLLQEVFLLQKAYVNAFDLLTQKKYEDSWNTFDHIDCALGTVELNFPGSIDSAKFNLDFISKMVKEYQKLFPYRFF